MLNKLFKLKLNHTDVKTEVTGGITTFLTMAYILAVNPSILAASGMDPTAIVVSTALAAFVGTLSMALLANYPFALAPGLGLNAYFAYTICGIMGYTWQFALFAVFVEGLIFITLSFFNVRENLFNIIPKSLKNAVTVGLGLFIAFIGLQNGKLISYSPATMVSMVDFTKDFHTQGIQALLSFLGILIIAVLYFRKVRGSFIIGAFIIWMLGILLEAMNIYKPNPEAGYYSLIPGALVSFDLSSLGKTFGQCFNMSAVGNVKVLDFLVIIFALLFMDLFDTVGTLIGVATRADMLVDNKLPRIRRALLADAFATSIGAVLGTSTTTTFVESSSGVAEGARTGLASVVTAFLFLLAIIFAPLFVTIPSFATSPILVFVGFIMISCIKNIDLTNIQEAFPAFLCIISIPFLYSISDGIAVGVISYVLINVFSGKYKRVHPAMFVISFLFVLKYIFL